MLNNRENNRDLNIDQNNRRIFAIIEQPYVGVWSSCGYCTISKWSDHMGCDGKVVHHDDWCNFNKLHTNCTFLVVMGACLFPELQGLVIAPPMRYSQMKNSELSL